ncbi:hypothetical protein ACFL0L_04845 [Patescibacteria group bacterium]
MTEAGEDKNKEQISSSHLSSRERDEKEQGRRRIVYSLFLFIGVAAIVFGVIEISQTFTSPFRLPETNESFTNSLASLDNVATIEDLRVKDTDEDGLNDYDELYTYQTSPYLEDSDSDGATDSEEINIGSDPNCPAGQNCFQPSMANTNAVTIFPDDNTVSLDTLRQALQDAGAPENIIQNLSDAELLDMYNDIVVESGGTPVNESILNANVNAETGLNTTSSIQVEDLENLTPDEIRSFLIESGVNEDLITDVDDETLQLIFQLALEEQLSS